MRFAIFAATALALCGFSSAYEVDESGFKVAFTDAAGTTKTYDVDFFDITPFEGDTPQRIGRQVFGADNVYNGNIKAELLSGPAQAYCYLHHWTGYTVSWEIYKATPMTESQPFVGDVYSIGGVSCYRGTPPDSAAGVSTGSRQLASASRVSRYPGSWLS